MSAAEAEVRAWERRWLDAYEQRDEAAMAAILSDDFTITYPSGTVMTKADVMRQLRQQSGSPSPRFFTEDVQSRAEGDRVILTGTFVMQSSRGASRSRYTDIWVRRPTGWQVVASELRAMPPS